jgi:hypothetical protein
MPETIDICPHSELSVFELRTGVPKTLPADEPEVVLTLRSGGDLIKLEVE